MRKENLLENTYIYTALVSFVTGIIAHGFAFANVLQNYDNINASFQGFGCGVESGRWLLTFLSMFMHKYFGGYNLPWFNGLMTIMLLSVAAALVAYTFQLKRTSATLTGILFVVFPTASCILFFRFVSMYDAFACLLAVFSAFIIPKAKLGIAISAICTALSLGVYQAYFPITVTTRLLLLLQMLLRGSSAMEVMKRGVRYLFSLVIGLVVYFLAQNCVQAVLDAELLEYQGISKMGSFQLAEVPYLIINAYRTFVTFPIKNYCGLTPNVLSVAAVIMLGGLSVFAIIMILISKKSCFMVCLQTGCIVLLLPVSIGLIEIMAPESSVYTMMIYSYVFVFIAPLIIIEELMQVATSTAGRRFQATSGATLVLIVAVCLNYIYLDNVNYTGMYYATKQTENYMNALVVQVRMTEGYCSNQKWAFIGDSFHDSLIAPEWADAPYYGGNAANYINAYSRIRWINTYFGYEIPLADEDVVEELMKMEQVRRMPCFPDYDSIRIINNTVVIKLENGSVD